MPSASIKEKGLQRFTANGLPVLSDGVITALLGSADNLWVHAKIYSAGGENALHEHPQEDHAFFVLQGVATFVDATEQETELRQYEGIMIPKGTLYRFQSGAEENLVMLRIGGAQRGEGDVVPASEFPAPMITRLGTDGLPQAGDSRENGTASRPVVEVPGQYFGV
jgi:mannose-6-phosphate isomerase-like protein (cupin superfamily)